MRKGELVACHRATGKARVVGARANDGMGTDEYTAVVGVARRPLAVDEPARAFAESADVRDRQLTDLRTGKKVTATSDEDTSNQVIALPGALVVAGRAGSPRSSPTGASSCSAASPRPRLAASGARVYWRVQGAVRARRARASGGRRGSGAPLARTIGAAGPSRRAAADRAVPGCRQPRRRSHVGVPAAARDDAAGDERRGLRGLAALGPRGRRTRGPASPASSTRSTARGASSRAAAARSP